MGFKEKTYELTAKNVIANLAKRNMEGFYCATKEDAVKCALSLMEEGAVIAWGGSESVKECGLMSAISDGKYKLIDRSAAVTPQEQRELFAKTAMSDYYLMGTNAITLDGQLVNIDGNGNRLASLIHGPRNVIIIAGMNKVAADVESAYKRVKTEACPPNAVRLDRKLPCAATGVCADCLAEECFCNQIVVTRRSGHAGRIKVILVGETLGY
ncbi:MAG: lactate utilization protein [Butyrivibrio sp.]|nr:lactate utilization protein [Butyrivibrio sp.]